MPATATRDRLLDAADTLMHRWGYEAVGVAELCAAADVRKGSFYYFFDSKQALALAMLERAWARTRDRLFLPTFADPAVGALEAIERYSSTLTAHMAAVVDDGGPVVGCRFGNFAVELATHDLVIRDHVAAVFDAMAAIIAEALDRGVRSGELRADLDAAAAADEFVALMEGRMVLAKASGDPAHMATLAVTARRLFAA